MTLSRAAMIAVAGVSSLALLVGCSGGGEAADSATAADTRTVTDATGTEVEVPADPQKIVTLHYAGTQALQDLGGEPSGQGPFPETGVPEDRVEALKKIPLVSGEEPDLEKVAEAEPDLILSPNTNDPAVIEQLNEIAPVFQFTLRGGDRANWTQRVEEVAEATNRTDNLEKLDSDFKAEQERIAKDNADAIKGKKVAVVSSFKENTAFIWGGDNMTGTLLKPLGFEWSSDEDAMVKENAKKTDPPEPEAEISAELLDKALGDADIIFVTSDLRGQYDELTKDLIDSAVFKELPAVKAGQVYPGGKSTIGGYADAKYGIEMAEKAVKSEANG